MSKDMLAFVEDTMLCRGAGDEGVGWVNIAKAEEYGFTKESFEKWAEDNKIETWFQRNGWKVWRV